MFRFGGDVGTPKDSETSEADSNNLFDRVPEINPRKMTITK